MTLSEDVLILQNCSGEIKLHQQALDHALKMMNESTLGMNNYTDKNKNAPDLWNLLNEQFEQAKKDFSFHQELIESAQKKEFKLKMGLLKKCIEQILTTYHDANNVLFAMRYDLDRKLGKKGAKKIKNSLDSIHDQLNNSYLRYIENLELKILEMDQ